MTRPQSILLFGMTLLLSVSLNSFAFAVDLFFEDFEDVELQPVVTFESELRERNAWQMVGENGPDGWTEENRTSSVGEIETGVREFEGWRFVNKDWWIRTSGNQGRLEWLNGTGTVAVADPDEWDDFGNPDFSTETNLDPEDGTWDSSLFTPEISLAGRPEGETVKLSFNSSWREEDLQTAILKANYDVGDPVELHTWTSSLGPAPNLNFKDDATDETLVYDLEIPEGASTVQFEFQLLGNNDWWWALDNIRVFTGGNPGEDGVLRTVINRESGNVSVVNNTGVDVDLRGYSIRSFAGAFDEANAQFLGQNAGWVTATVPGGNTNDLSELHLESSVLEAGAAIDLGNVWLGFFEELADVTFNYVVSGRSDQITGNIEFVGNEGQPFDTLDLNFDGTVNLLDWGKFKAGYGSDLAGLTSAVSYNLGDLDLDGQHTLNDFTEFFRLFETANGAGSFEAMQASVPEPSSFVLFVMCLLGTFQLWRRIPTRAAMTLIVGAACCLVGNDAQAQLVLLDEDFESLPLMPHVEEGGGGGGNVWTNVPPPGWTTDNSGVPGIGDTPIELCEDPALCDGVFDWANWAFVDKTAWIAADDQGRSDFELGFNTVMVADPDEWDDADGGRRDAIATCAEIDFSGEEPSCVRENRPDDLYDVFATTPEIAIPEGIPAGRIKLSFLSSWFGNEFQDDLDGDNNQTALINVSYDGGRAFEVFRRESDPDSETYDPVQRNERISEIDLEYDGEASTLQLEFGLTDAWNDWWWALDNLLISVPTDPAVLRINTATGEASLAGDDVIPSNIKSISIASPSGQLREPTGASGLNSRISERADGPDSGEMAGDSLGERWELLSATENQFAEAFLFGDSVFDNTRSESLGRIVNVADIGTDPNDAALASDISFTYSLGTGAIVEGGVEFFFEMSTEPIPFDCDSDGFVTATDVACATQDTIGDTLTEAGFLAGDFDLDGQVSFLDFLQLANNFGQPVSSYSEGDANLNGTVDFLDFLDLANNFGKSAAALAAVPEPSAGLLLTIAAFFGLSLRRGRRVSALAAVVSACVFSMPARGQLPPEPTVDRLYQFGEDDEGSEIGSPVSQMDNRGNFVTFDAVGELQMRQLIDLVVESSTSRRATYVDTSDRPDGNGGMGIQLNSLPFDRQYLRTGFGEALNFPEQSPSSIASVLNIGGTVNYFRINDRGFELWAKPTAVTGEHHIVMDSNQHGVLIDSDGNFAMRYASKFEVETTVDPGADGEFGTADDTLDVSAPIVTPANYATDVKAEADQWYHLSVVRPNGPGNGSIFYVNGIAEAIAFGQYAVETVVNIGEGEVFTNIDSLDSSPLTVGRATNSESFDLNVADSFFFRGIVDDLEMFVLGLNDNDNLAGFGDDVLNDYGEYVFQRDNDYAQAFAPAVNGDLNEDGEVTIADANAFVDNWLFENRLSGVNPFTGVESSRLIGDLSTRALGDFDYNGVVNLEDWAILNDANPAAGAAAIRMIESLSNVPEPSSLVMTLLLLVPLMAFRRRDK